MQKGVDDVLSSSQGYKLTLADGVESRLRWDISGGVAVSQIRRKQRFRFPDEHNLDNATRRALPFSSSPASA